MFLYWSFFILILPSCLKSYYFHSFCYIAKLKEEGSFTPANMPSSSILPFHFTAGFECYQNCNLSLLSPLLQFEHLEQSSDLKYFHIGKKENLRLFEPGYKKIIKICKDQNTVRPLRGGWDVVFDQALPHQQFTGKITLALLRKCFELLMDFEALFRTLFSFVRNVLKFFKSQFVSYCKD